MKRCRKCGEEKDAAEFQLRSDTGRYRTECRSCRSADNLARYHHRTETEDAHHRASRKFYLKKLYGMTWDDYEALLEQQGGVCAICGREPDSARGLLCVDHDHATGLVRGLLCRKCNTGIGLFEDSTKRLTHAINYLGG